MSYMDDFQAEEIAEIFGLPTDKVETELGKVGSLLPNLTKNQPESVAAYLTDWRVLLLGADRFFLPDRESGLTASMQRLPKQPVFWMSR